MEFNRFIYDNIATNIECQVDFWLRKADNPNLDDCEARALRLKAEGLGYAVRLLGAFKPEFMEITEYASRVLSTEQFRHGMPNLAVHHPFCTSSAVVSKRGRGERSYIF